MPLTCAFESHNTKAYIEAQGFVFEYELLDLVAVHHETKSSTEAFELFNELRKENKIKFSFQKQSVSKKELLLSENMFKKFLNDFPAIESWRFFIDGKKQTSIAEDGWNGYEKREPGCIQTMYEAFELACSTRSELDVTHALAIHKKRRIIFLKIYLVMNLIDSQLIR